ncbi:MAG: hypothetical protein K6T51_01345 [Rubrobacteraceae bacterium]|nr:hypothetical protein [Rubrobacteraceae bacterium]
MGENRLEHNAREIARYLEFAPSYIGPGAPPSEPLSRKYRGGSRPPVTDGAFRFWEENARVSRLLNPLIEELRRSNAAFGGVAFSSLILELYSDPTSVSRWHEHARRRLRAFRAMCMLLASVLERHLEEDEKIHVWIPRRYERVRNRTEARDLDRAFAREDALRLLAASLHGIMARLGCGPEEAIRNYQKVKQVSRSRCYEALRFARDDDHPAA